MNRQRLVIYEERRRVLEGEDIHDQVQHFLVDTVSRELLREEILADARAAYEVREEELGSEAMRELERRVILSVLDRKWREHLYEMDYLRDGIGLRAMAQRDPLIEYQREGYDLFRAMMDSIQEETVGLLFNLEVSVGADGELDDGDDEFEELDEFDELELLGDGDVGELEAEVGRSAPSGSASRPKGAAAGVGAQGGHPMADLKAAGLGPRRPDHVQYSAPSETGEATVVGTAGVDEFAGVGRNEACPCGSGKKFKRCHGDPRLRN